MRQWQLNRLSDLLLLRVHTTNILIGDIGTLLLAKHCDRRVRFWRKNVDESIGVSVKSHG